MAKTRVYELARELNIESKQLVARIKNAGIEINSHQSTLTPGQVDDIRKLIAGEQVDIAKPKKRVVIRRRKKVEPEPEVAPEELSAEPVQAEQAPEPTEPSIAVEAETATDLTQEAPIVEALAVATPSSEPDEVKDVQLNATEQPSTKKAPSTPTMSARAAKLAKTAKPRVKSSATIVRKASPEEASRALRQQTENAAKRGGGNEAYSTRGPSNSGGSGNYPPSSNADPRKAGGFAPKKTAKEEEEERVRRLNNIAKQKRSNMNARMLLREIASVSTPDELLDRTKQQSRRRTFTPSASMNRKRDLKRRKDLKKTEITTPRDEYRVVEMQKTIKVGDLAKQLSVKSNELIKKLMAQGEMLTINDKLDFDTVQLIVEDYNYTVKSVEKKLDDIIVTDFSSHEQLRRPPVVTVMGHVDHGKTSILDAIRKTDIAAGEAGGITQHIGAYTVDRNGQRTTFLDTPGHEAFSAMRARGASVTDIVILVVAADDGVMPQTVEAISHAKAAGVPIIVAVNKIDKPEKKLDRLYTQLTEHGIQSEEWGGETQFVKVSAINGTGIDELLESINLLAEVSEFKSTNDHNATGVVVEAHLDKKRGPIASVIVTAGTLKTGDTFVSGEVSGRVRLLSDYKGQKAKTATPSEPVEIIGFDSVPSAGDTFHVVADEKKAKEIISWRRQKRLHVDDEPTEAQTLEQLLAKAQEADRPELALIVKADTQGSLEAVCESILKLNNEQVTSKILHKATGGITESDISLAQTSSAVIIAFNVRAPRGLDMIAEKAKVPISYFSIIYELVDSVKDMMAGKLPAILKEVFQGRADIRQLISVPKIGNIGGCAITDGKVFRNSHLRLIRDSVVIYEGKVGSLRRFKDDVKEVASGYECGIGIEGYNDIRIGDTIEAFKIEEERPTL